MASLHEGSPRWGEGYERRLEDRLQRFGMTVPHIARSLSLEEKIVLCVYLVGSRFWGTAGARSDWDFIVVTTKSVWSGVKPVDRHAGNVDGHVLTRDQFEAGLRAQRFRYLLCLHLPKVCVLRSSWTPKWSLDSRALLETFGAEKERDLRMARKYFAKGDRFRACKTLVHSLRMLVLGEELVETGDMTKFDCGSEQLNRFQRETPTEWSAVQAFVDGELTRAEHGFARTIQKVLK